MRIAFNGRVLVFDEAAGDAFGWIMATRRAVGRPMSNFDAQIAAITRVMDAFLVTRNGTDFDRCGVRVINPFDT